MCEETRRGRQEAISFSLVKQKGQNFNEKSRLFSNLAHTNERKINITS